MRWIHDVSTDADDPPPFVALREVRLACANGADYSGLSADEHRKRYPDLQTSVFNQPLAQVFGTALAFADALNWNVAAAIEHEGRIEATATTPLLRFKDDVVIRIRVFGNTSRLDIRSASRIGSSDLGANAKRIRTFLDNLNSSLKTNT
ncbi:MAG: DUF1499 domain-containing protein [Burkholderiales bacterium]